MLTLTLILFFSNENKTGTSFDMFQVIRKKQQNNREVFFFVLKFHLQEKTYMSYFFQIDMKQACLKYR